MEILVKNKEELRTVLNQVDDKKTFVILLNEKEEGEDNESGEQQQLGT